MSGDILETLIRETRIRNPRAEAYPQPLQPFPPIPEPFPQALTCVRDDGRDLDSKA